MPPPLACFEDVKARITNAYQNVVEEMTPEQEEDMQQEEQDVLDFVTPVDTQRSEEVTDMPVTLLRQKACSLLRRLTRSTEMLWPRSVCLIFCRNQLTRSLARSTRRLSSTF